LINRPELIAPARREWMGKVSPGDACACGDSSRWAAEASRSVFVVGKRTLVGFMFSTVVSRRRVSGGLTGGLSQNQDGTDISGFRGGVLNTELQRTQ